MSRHEELDRFHAGGKTFFFNKGKARNGNEYLAIKGLWGQGNQEQIVLFPGQMLQFYKLYLDALEELTGLRPGNSEVPEPAVQERLPGIPIECPQCGTPCDYYKVVAFDKDDWGLECSKCNKTIIYQEE